MLSKGLGPHRGCREILGCGIKEQRGARFVFMQHGRGSGVGCVGGCRCCSRTVGHRSPNDSGFRKESFPAQLASLVAQHLPAVQETRVPSLRQEGPLEKTMATHSSTLAGESHGRRNLVGYNSLSKEGSLLGYNQTLGWTRATDTAFRASLLCLLALQRGFPVTPMPASCPHLLYLHALYSS